MLREWLSKAAGRPRGKQTFAAELAVLAAVGLFLGIIGPFGTDAAPTLRRLGYWIANIVGGGVIGILIDRLLIDRIRSHWPRVVLVSLLMTPAVTLLVVANAALFFLHRASVHAYVDLLWQVFVIALPVMVVRMLVWRRPRPVVRRQMVVVPPVPDAEARFRRRLSARLRTTPLIALEAHDHYVKVHTDAGTELLTMKFADAIDELSGAHGFRIHRSWWVAADAIEKAHWSRASGEVRLIGGLTAPVSRSGAPLLKAAGWL